MDAVAEHGKFLKKHTLHVSADTLQTLSLYFTLLPYVTVP